MKISKLAGFKPSTNAQLTPIRQLDLFGKRNKIEADATLADADKKSRLAEIDHFFVGIAQLEHLGRADVADDVVADKHRALLKRLGRDGKNVLCAQKHVCPANYFLGSFQNGCSSEQGR